MSAVGAYVTQLPKEVRGHWHWRRRCAQVARIEVDVCIQHALDECSWCLGEQAVLEHRRRIAFYERAGGVLLPVRDYAPPHGDDLPDEDEDGHAPCLRLMCLPLGDGDPPPAREVLLAAMTLRYDLTPDHPAVLTALATLSR